jgi:hypothetical protein
LRRLLRWVLRGLGAFVVLVGLYVALGFGLAAIPVAGAAPEPGAAIEIAIFTSPVHTDLVVPVRTETVDWRAWWPAGAFAGATEQFTHVSFGWGGRGFYLETPNWSDLKVMRALTAVSGLGATAMHVELGVGTSNCGPGPPGTHATTFSGPAPPVNRRVGRPSLRHVAHLRRPRPRSLPARSIVTPSVALPPPAAYPPNSSSSCRGGDRAGRNTGTSARVQQIAIAHPAMPVLMPVRWWPDSRRPCAKLSLPGISRYRAGCAPTSRGCCPREDDVGQARPGGPVAPPWARTRRRRGQLGR